MRYRNTQTGAVIEVQSVISGGFWEIIPEQKPEKAEPQPRARKGKATNTNE